MSSRNRQAAYALSALMAECGGAQPAFTQVLPSGACATLSFGEVDALATAFSAYLCGHLGFCPGDMVAVQLPNMLHFPVAVLGAWKAGLVVTLLDPLLPVEAVAAQLAASGTRALVLADQHLDPAQRIADALGIKLIVASLWDFLPAPQAQIVRERLEGASPRQLNPDVAHHRFDGALVIGRRLARVRRRGGSPSIPVVLHDYLESGTGRAFSLAALKTEYGQSGLIPRRDSADGVLFALPLWRRQAFALDLLGFYGAGVHSLLVPDLSANAHLRPALEGFKVRWLVATDSLFDTLRGESWYAARPVPLEYVLNDDGVLRIADCPDARRRCWVPLAA